MREQLKKLDTILSDLRKNKKTKSEVSIDQALTLDAEGNELHLEDIIGTEEIPEELAKTGDFFGLKIHGDSMEPRMFEGDVVIVRQQEDAESGDIVIAMVNGNDATCKRLLKYESGISLISLNQKYEPMMFTNEDILEKPVKIIGKVVELRGKL